MRFFVKPNFVEPNFFYFLVSMELATVFLSFKIELTIVLLV